MKYFPGDNCSVCDPADGGRDRQRRNLPQAKGENLWSMCLESSLWDLVNVCIKHLEMVHSRHKKNFPNLVLPKTKIWVIKKNKNYYSALNPDHDILAFLSSPYFHKRCSLSDHFSLPNKKLRERILIQGTLETLCFEIRIVWYLTLPEVSARGEKMMFNEWKGFAKTNQVLKLFCENPNSS